VIWIVRSREAKPPNWGAAPPLSAGPGPYNTGNGSLLNRTPSGWTPTTH